MDPEMEPACKSTGHKAWDLPTCREPQRASLNIPLDHAIYFLHTPIWQSSYIVAYVSVCTAQTGGEQS